MKIFKKFFSSFLIAVLTFSSAFPAFSAQTVQNKYNYFERAQKIISWKKSDNGAGQNEYLINNKFLEQAGTTPGDWYPIGLGRLNIKDNNEGYLAVIKDVVKNRYKESGKLSAAKATEWHRISLAISAMGGDPTNIENGSSSINLIADGTYDRGKTTPLGRQGINGWIWGLIALDSMRYEVPDDAYYSREDIIVQILSSQLKDGGFALSGDLADTDITAMAVQALSPYYNSEKEYSYYLSCEEKEVKKSVHTVIEQALQCLSALQLETGDFESWGTQNVESTDQVVVALCSLGIDPLSDNRFIKNNHTLLDGIMRYQMPDGGFVHSFAYDSDNPTSLPDKSNTMAGEQTLYTMAALWRQKNSMRTLYDFRKEHGKKMRQRLQELDTDILKISSKTKPDEIKNMLEKFYSIPENERCYVKNYWTLSAAAKKKKIDIQKIADTTKVENSDEDDENTSGSESFSQTDKQLVDSLSDTVTTESYALVVTLLDKLEKSPDFSGKQQYFNKLSNLKDKIEKIQAEIDSINNEIKEKLYPFEKITLKQKPIVDKIVSRYNALSEYDRTKILRYEDVIKTKTKLDNEIRAVIIALVLAMLGTALAVFLTKRIKRRRQIRQNKMPIPEDLYEE